MKRKMKRAASFLLVLAMVLGLLPAVGLITAYAVTMEGSVEEVYSPGPGKLYVRGWAMDLDAKSQSIEVHVYIGDSGYNIGFTNIYREDVNNTHDASGNHGFETTIDTTEYGTKDVRIAIMRNGTAKWFTPGSYYIQPDSIPTYGEDSWNISKDSCPKLPDALYRIVPAANTDFSLDISGGSTENNANLQIWTKASTDAQVFYLRRIHYEDLKTGNGIYETRTVVGLMNIKSQRYLDNDSNSANVHQWGEAPETAERQWVLVPNADGTYSFETVASGEKGYRMTVESSKFENGVNVCVAPNNDSIYQKFYLIPEYVFGDNSALGGYEDVLAVGEYRFWVPGDSTHYNERVLDIEGLSKEDNGNAHVWEAGDQYSLNQIFEIQKDGDGWYTVRCINSGRFLNAAGGASGVKRTNVHQYYDATDASKWAFIPILRSDGTYNYWVVNKATGLYLNRQDTTAVDGTNVMQWTSRISSAWSNGARVNTSTISWCMQAWYSAASKGTTTNNATNIVPDTFDPNDTISLPIKIYDYPNDGLLFEYSEDGSEDNRAFGLLRSSRNSDYTSWAIGQTTTGAGSFLENENDSQPTYFVGENKFWTASPDGLNRIYQVNQGSPVNPNAYNGYVLNMDYLSSYLGYSVHGDMTFGLDTMGLVKPTLRVTEEGYKLPEYNDEVVAYIADLLEKTLTNRDEFWQLGTIDYPVGTEDYTDEMGYHDDLAGMLLHRLKYEVNGGTTPRYSANDSERRTQIYNDIVATMAKEEQLIGTWSECRGDINTYTDAAYFLLNNLFVPGSYNMPQDDFDYLVLSKAKLINGKTAYVFDSGFSDTVDYDSDTMSAVEYDFDAKTISNTSMTGKPGYHFLDYYTTANYAFLPVWNEDQTTQHATWDPYQDSNSGSATDPQTYVNKNFNYVLQCNGVFTYDENEGLFFDFAGDDDVYLFINNQLVLDIGGGHSITTVEMDLNEYVYEARQRVADGSTDPRDLALALEDGKEYSFDFYYMERHGYGANLRIATNIRVSDPNVGTEKKAYQNDRELSYGGLVDTASPVEYSFKLSNPANSLANLYHLSFTDSKLGLELNSQNGLSLNSSKAINSAGTALTAADLKIYFTNQKGVTQEIVLDGTTAEEQNEALKTFLHEVNGDGLLPGCSVEIRGVFCKLAASDFESGRFANTLFVTANSNADGSGNTYQASDNMVVCKASGPQYYQWGGKTLNVTKDIFAEDVNELLQNENSALLEQIAPATSLGTVSNMQLCDMSGNVTYSNYVTVSASGISIAYTAPGAYVFYVRVTQSDNSIVVVPVQVYVTTVEDSVFVLDYGLKVDFSAVLTAKDSLAVPGRTTAYAFEAITSDTPSYGSNHITFSSPSSTVNGSYGNFVITDDNRVEYHPDGFMSGADTVYAAVRVYEGTPGSTVGTVDINREVEMFKKITVLPANVVYYEDDFPAIRYYDKDEDNSANIFTPDGEGSGAIYQSADQTLQYGFDHAYDSSTAQSGNSGHVIKILDANVAAEFVFAGTGFELIGRSVASDNCVIYLDVLDSAGTLVKRIPVIMEYNNDSVLTDEGVYQVPVVRVDDLDHGTYKVQIHGVPTYTEQNGSYVIDTNNPPTLYIDGIRIYNSLPMSDPNREHYTDGEDTAQFLEIRDLILEGKAAALDFDSDSMILGTGFSTFTENRNGETYPVNVFTLNSVAYEGYFADAPTDTDTQNSPQLNLYSESTAQGNSQLVFTLAKTENGTNYYHIHIQSGGTERYLKRSDVTADVKLVSTAFQNPTVTSPDNFLWKLSYLDETRGIVTIQSKADGSYLSAVSVDAAAKTGKLQAVTAASVTDAQKWELAAVEATEVFEGNQVSSVNDYLLFGPNNELYLDGISLKQALVFYFTPDRDDATTSMLQVGVRVLNDNHMNGINAELTEAGVLYQSANTGTPGWKILDDNIRSSTERYYPIDLNLCKYDAANDRYEVVLYCVNGYLSFSNLKISGGSIRSIGGETADLCYNNGVLGMLTDDGTGKTRVWAPVADAGAYPDFVSLTEQMGATMIYEVDMDTGEFVPAESDTEDQIYLAGRSLLFKDIIKMRFYFDLSNSGMSEVGPDNSGLLTWTEEEYAALSSYTVDTAGTQLCGLTFSANGYYADTQGIPAKNMVDKLYVRAYVILPNGSYVYSDITEFSPVMYAQLVLESETTTATMKDLVVALMNYGAAAQTYFNYKTDTLMNAWLPAELQQLDWSDELINALPTDRSKFSYEADSSITLRGSSVTFVGAVNQNFYFNIPEELTETATTVELLYWTESDYEALSELTVDNARRVDFSLADGRAVVEGTAAKNLGNAIYFAVRIVNAEGEYFSRLYTDSAHDYARRVLSSSSTTDAMKELAMALVIYSCKAEAQLGGEAR